MLLRAVNRMLGSRLHILMSLILIASMGYYIFYYFQEKQKLTYEFSGLKLKFQRCMVVSSKYEKKYKTSHSNEQLFAQSNRDLQVNLAKQEKDLAEVSVQLDKEKVKLGEAYLFYTHMKDMFGVSRQLQNSFEKKVEPVVINALKDKFSQWKSELAGHELLKINHSQLLRKYTELNNAHESLHNSNRRLQKVNVKNFNEYSKLKKRYDNLVINYKNVTNVYSMQVAIDNKLQKQLNNYKPTQRQINKVTKKTQGKRRLKKAKGVKDAIDVRLRGSEMLGDKLKPEVMVVKENKTDHVAKFHKEYIVNKTYNIAKLTNVKASSLASQRKDNVSMIKNYKPSENLERDKQVNLSTRFVHVKEDGSSIINKKKIKTLLPKRHKSVNVDVKPNKTSMAKRGSAKRISTISFHRSTKNRLRLSKDSKLLQSKTTNAPTSTSKNADNVKNVHTLTKDKTAIVHPTASHTEVPLNTESVDEVDEYLERENEEHANNTKDFDEENKYDPPHIKDVLNENGLSVRSTVD